MQRRVIGFGAVILLACVQCAATAPPASATIQSDEICWDPDVEWPVPCDDEDD